MLHDLKHPDLGTIMLQSLQHAARQKHTCPNCGADMVTMGWHGCDHPYGCGLWQVMAQAVLECPVNGLNAEQVTALFVLRAVEVSGGSGESGNCYPGNPHAEHMEAGCVCHLFVESWKVLLHGEPVNFSYDGL